MIILSKVSSGFQISPEMRGLKLGKIRMSQGPECSRRANEARKILKAGVDFFGGLTSSVSDLNVDRGMGIVGEKGRAS